jgi:NADH:ubiquinone oxidoreductase subunit H
VLIFLFVCFFYLVGGWNLRFKIYEYTRISFIFCLPFFFIWLLVILVERNRLPYDFLEGESELVSGFNTEYWGGYFSFLFIYEYGAILLFSIMTGFFLFRGFASFFVFVFVMYFFLWIRSTLPRFRYDFLIDIVWKKFLFLVISMLLYFVFL